MDAATSSERPSQLSHAVLHRRRRSGRHDAGISVGAGRRRYAGAGETRRFLSGFSRRHRASLDASGDGRTRPDRRVPEAAASATAENGGQIRRRLDPYRRSRPSQGQIPLHRLHAAMGLSQFPARERQAICLAQGHDECRCDRPDLVGRCGGRREGQYAGGAGRNPRGSDHRMRRPAFDRAAVRQSRGRRDRRADGCAVVSRRQAGQTKTKACSRASRPAR